MRKGIKKALLRVTEIVVHAETERSQEVHARDKAYEKFHLWASLRLLDYTTPLKRGGQTKKSPAAEDGAQVRLGRGASRGPDI